MVTSLKTNSFFFHYRRLGKKSVKSKASRIHLFVGFKRVYFIQLLGKIMITNIT